MKTSRNISVDIKNKKEFFSRGKEIARLADKGSELPTEKTIWFEDVKDFNRFISDKKIHLLSQIRQTPCSITELAKMIGRNRTAVARDIDELELSGLVITEMVCNPGHGKFRLVKPIAKNLVLQIKI